MSKLVRVLTKEEAPAARERAFNEFLDVLAEQGRTDTVTDRALARWYVLSHPPGPKLGPPEDPHVLGLDRRWREQSS